MRLIVNIEHDEDTLAEFCERIGWEPSDGSFAEAIKSEILSNLYSNRIFADVVIEIAGWG